LQLTILLFPDILQCWGSVLAHAQECTYISLHVIVVHDYNGVHDIMAVGPWKGIVC